MSVDMSHWAPISDKPTILEEAFKELSAERDISVMALRSLKDHDAARHALSVLGVWNEEMDAEVAANYIRKLITRMI